MHPILIDGRFRPANSSGSFHAENPATSQPLPDEYPISNWADCDAALAAASRAAEALRAVPGVERVLTCAPGGGAEVMA